MNTNWHKGFLPLIQRQNPFIPQAVADSVRFTAQAFQKLIEREDDRVELRTGTGSRPLQEALVAMSNTDGGRVFIGVTDKREVVGRRLDQGG